jgi:hypothetical protein
MGTIQLLPRYEADKLPALYATDGLDPSKRIASVKFFDPSGSWSWYPLEYDPAEGLFFGLVDGWEIELGYFTLAELSAFRGSLGLPIERDKYFHAIPLDQLMRQLQRERSNG